MKGSIYTLSMSTTFYALIHHKKVNRNVSELKIEEQ